MSTGQGGAAERVDPASAAAWLRDLLEQLGDEADAVLSEVLADRDVRGLRVVGPLQDQLGASKRSGLCGEVGRITRLHSSAPQPWHWEATGACEARLYSQRPRGNAPTRLAADRALCLALRELGWSPVEVPEEAAAAEPAPSARSVSPALRYVRVAEVGGGDGVRFEYLSLSVREQIDGFTLELRNEGGNGMGYDITIEPDPNGHLVVEWEGTQTRARRADTDFLWPERGRPQTTIPPLAEDGR